MTGVQVFIVAATLVEAIRPDHVVFEFKKCLYVIQLQ